MRNALFLALGFLLGVAALFLRHETKCASWYVEAAEYHASRFGTPSVTAGDAHRWCFEEAVYTYTNRTVGNAIFGDPETR